MAGKEWFVFVTETFKSFQFTGYVDCSICIMSYIKRYYANRVTGDKEFIPFFIVKSKSEDAVQLFEEMNTFVLVKCQNDFAVTTCPEFIASGIPGTYFTVIIDFAVNGKNLFTVGRVKGLSSTLRIYNGKAFVCEDCTASGVNTTPIRTTMTDFLCHA